MGWQLPSLAGWLTRQLGGYYNPIARSLALRGWPSGSLDGCLALQLSGYGSPIIVIPFTAVLSNLVLLHHLCPEGPANLVQNDRLYPVWTIGSNLSLPGKKVFSGSDHVSVLDNTSWVRVRADLLPRQA